MGKKKKYLIKSINFGDVNEPARILIEKYLKMDKSITKSKTHQQELSNLMRKIAYVFLSNRPELKDWKKELLIYERKELIKKNSEILAQLKENEKDLERWGVNIYDIDWFK